MSSNPSGRRCRAHFQQPQPTRLRARAPKYSCNTITTTLLKHDSKVSTSTDLMNLLSTNLGGVPKCHAPAAWLATFSLARAPAAHLSFSE